jgi:DNA polymerase-3 subunit beta
VIPTGNDKEMRVDCQSFTKAVDRVSTISSERGRAVKLSLTEGQLVLTVNNPDSGSATEEVAVGYDNDPMEIGFNAKYLLDITAQLSGDDAIFMLADAGSPTLVRDLANEEALYVLMPMRV